MNEHSDASGRLTIDFEKIESGMYSKVTKAVASEFGLEPSGAKTKGLDEIFQDYKLGNEIVVLEWDNWSGYIVNAKTESAEKLVRNIAGYISANFNT